jgi:hypothetical protein
MHLGQPVSLGIVVLGWRSHFVALQWPLGLSPLVLRNGIAVSQEAGSEQVCCRENRDASCNENNTLCNEAHTAINDVHSIDIIVIIIVTYSIAISIVNTLIPIMIIIINNIISIITSIINNNIIIIIIIINIIIIIIINIITIITIINIISSSSSPHPHGRYCSHRVLSDSVQRRGAPSRCSEIDFRGAQMQV